MSKNISPPVTSRLLFRTKLPPHHTRLLGAMPQDIFKVMEFVTPTNGLRVIFSGQVVPPATIVKWCSESQACVYWEENCQKHIADAISQRITCPGNLTCLLVSNPTNDELAVEIDLIGLSPAPTRARTTEAVNFGGVVGFDAEGHVVGHCQPKKESST